MNELATAIDDSIKTKIYTIRGMQVMLDSDLAELYDVESKRLNEQVKRNSDRFPQNFMFQLTEEEHQNLRSQFATSSLRSQIVTIEHGGRRYLPYVFTEQGVAMLSAVLRSQTAVQMSIHIINAFVEMRRFISNNALIFQRLDSLEQKQFKTDDKVEAILNAIEDKSLKAKQGIFYDGQVYKEVYHIGASLKDLGKKWFAFSKFDMGALEILGRLK